MFKKMTTGVIDGLKNVITIVLLIIVIFAVAKWGKANPDQMQTVTDKVADTVVTLVNWTADTIAAAVDG